MGRYPSKMKVVAYRLDGSIFRIYDSARIASKNRHAHPRTIDKCIRGDTLTAYGYMWRRYPVNEIPKNIEPLKRKDADLSAIPIVEIDENGNVIRRFDSIKKAGKELGVDPRSIRDVLAKKRKQAKGHIFKKENDD